MANLPKITIITPSFNQGEFLEETMLSVLNQDYPNLEYIVIDGGSSDQSVEIIKKHASKLSFWVSEKDSGQSEAINKGLKRATGDIISWLCSDDLYESGALIKAAERFRQFPEAGLIHGKSILFGSGRRHIIRGSGENDLPLRYFALIPFPQPGSFFTRKTVNTVGLLDESLHFGMDYDFVARTAFHIPIVRTDDIFARYRFHAESKSVGRSDKFTHDWIRVFTRFILSTEVSSELVEKLKSAGFISDGEIPYRHDRRFTDAELNTITCYFLFNQLVIWYDLLEKERTKTILDLIEDIDTGFYRNHHLNTIRKRIQYLPSSMIRTLRKLIR